VWNWNSTTNRLEPDPETLYLTGLTAYESDSQVTKRAASTLELPKSSLRLNNIE
jgi:hypothetical protein